MGRLSCLALGALTLVGLASPASGESFRLYTDRAGVHEVYFEELAEAGLAAAIESERVRLENLGRPVPLWIEDGGDGRFGPGDRLEFVAARAAGARAYFHEYARRNVYVLRADEDGGPRMRPSEAVPTAAGSADGRSGWRRTVHLERDRLLARVSGEDLGAPGERDEAELWFWEKLTHVDRERLEIPLDLRGLDPERRDLVRIDAHLRGLSSKSAYDETEVHDHQVDFALDSRRLGSTTWDGRVEHLARLEPQPPRRLAPRADEPARSLSLRVPRRRPAGSDDPVVDVVMLNWVEVDYPHDGVISGEQTALYWSGAAGRPRIAAAQSGLVAYGESGGRVSVAAGAHALLPTDPEERAFWLVPEGSHHTVERFERDAPSDLRGAGRQADYLMIAHATLLAEAARLADFHRERGLTVELVDVQDVYDEFGHGLVHPRAIRDFVDHAYEHWPRPAPRYVLLVGDASWDTKNAVADDALYANWVDRQLVAPDDFRAKNVEGYEGDERVADRNLIPTYSFHTKEGHAASDNWFASVAGDDYLPDLAIGRLPVAAPSTLRGVVDKLIRYGSEPPDGDWRRRILWIANEWEWLQDRSREIDEEIAPLGLASQRVFPSADEPTNEHHQAFLSRAFNDGQLFVHFAGHGGRFIWRTGPRDLGDKNVDLFTLEHVEALEPNDKLPIVFSMTCHSGPFDHPTADSIAERFLRLPDRGAIAVISASWRTSAASTWLSRALMLEFTKGGAIGDAFLRAKRRMEVEDLVATYNLFGDPALPMALRLPGGVAQGTAPDQALVSPDSKPSSKITSQESGTPLPLSSGT